MDREEKSLKDVLESYPFVTIFFNNFILLLQILLGILACNFFSSIAAVFYGIFFLLGFFLLKKLVCSHCYYYDRWCSFGWGKLSALLSKKDMEKSSKYLWGIKIAPFFYGILEPLPILLIIILLIKKFEIDKIILLIAFLSISFYSGSIRRKRNCSLCKMKNICPGSTVK